MQFASHSWAAFDTDLGCRRAADKDGWKNSRVRAKTVQAARTMCPKLDDLRMTPKPTSPDGILETAIYADDLQAAEVFYGGVLGLETVVAAPGRHVFFRCGAGMLLVFNPSATAAASASSELPAPPHGSHGPGHVCFATAASEIDAWRRTFLAENIAIDADFWWPNGARSLYIRDPAGNSVEFAEARLWAK